MNTPPDAHPQLVVVAPYSRTDERPGGGVVCEDRAEAMAEWAGAENRISKHQVTGGVARHRVEFRSPPA